MRDEPLVHPSPGERSSISLHRATVLAPAKCHVRLRFRLRRRLHLRRLRFRRHRSLRLEVGDRRRTWLLVVLLTEQLLLRDGSAPARPLSATPLLGGDQARSRSRYGRANRNTFHSTPRHSLPTMVAPGRAAACRGRGCTPSRCPHRVRIRTRGAAPPLPPPPTSDRQPCRERSTTPSCCGCGLESVTSVTLERLGVRPECQDARPGRLGGWRQLLVRKQHAHAGWPCLVFRLSRKCLKVKVAAFESCSWRSTKTSFLLVRDAIC